MLSIKKIYVVAKIFFVLLSIAVQINAQTVVQQLRGVVTDADNRQPLSGVSIKLIDTQLGTITNSDGGFLVQQIPVGQYTLRITHVGYDTLLLPEVRIDAAKEKILEIHLKEATQKLSEVTVKQARPVAFGSVQRITIEQTLRYAATFFDPARLMTSFPGVVAANDQANGLISNKP